MTTTKVDRSGFLLFLLVFIFIPSRSRGFIPIINRVDYLLSSRQQQFGNHPQRLSSSTLYSSDSDEDKDSPPYYENTRWYKPLKTSLIRYGTDSSAQPWILNVIEWAHLALFPLSFWLAWTIYSNQQSIIAAIGPGGTDDSVVFWILLSHLCQTFGTSVAGLVYHEYEDWQFAEFRAPPPAKGFNDARLREVFLGVLLGLLTLSSFLMVVGVYGGNNPILIQGLIIASVIIKLFCPKTPAAMTVLTPLLEKLGTSDLWNAITNGRPVLPISIWDFGLFMIHTIFASAAYVTLFSSPIQHHWPILPTPVCGLLSIVPFTTVALGGLYEGLIAETSFNQWDHLIGVAFFAVGIWLQTLEFGILR